MSAPSRRRRWPWKLIPLAVAAVVAPIGVAVTALPSSAATGVAPATGGTYQLIGSVTDKCLDIANYSTENGGLLHQWGCADQTNQQFRVQASGTSGRFLLVGVGSGRCLDVPSGTTSVVQVQQWGCGDGNKVNQQWTFVASGTGTYRIVNAASNMCLSVEGASTANGTRIIQETCTENSNKRFAFVPPGGTGNPPSGVPYGNSPDGFAGAAGTTGGAGGQTVTVTTQAQLNQYVTASAPYVIRVSGTINISPKGTELRVASNKTIIGVGTAGHIVGGGFFIGTGVSNVIIRNLTIRDTLMPDDDPGDDAYDYDAIQIDTANRIWIDHNRLTRMNDGLLDSRKDTTNITVSWNHFADQNKTFGIGWTENVTARMTIHHNWFQNTRTRNPSADNLAAVHLFNNYLQNCESYGNYVRGLSKAVIENSYYENVRNPYYVEAGELVARGNIKVNSPTDSGKVTAKGSAFNPSSFYSYTLHPAADIPAMLRQHAGPQASIGT